MVKIIAIKSLSGSAKTSPTSYGTNINLALGQTYDVPEATADDLINQGAAIDYTTALQDVKCPKIIRTTPIKWNVK